MANITVNKDNIQEVVITGSMNKTVLLFIFDPQNPASATIKAAITAATSVAEDFLTIAEADAHDPIIQQVCMQIGISSLPAICVFSGGRPVDIVTAERLQDAAQASEAIKAYIPAQDQIFLAQALKLAADNKFSEAYQQIKQAYALNDKDINIKFTMADMAIKNKKIEEARTVLDSVDANNRIQKTYTDLESALTLAEASLKNPASKQMEEKLAANPDDLELVSQLATAWSQEGKIAEALELLLKYLRKDLNAGDLKKIYLDILATINGDPLQPVYRRKLYTLLY